MKVLSGWKTIIVGTLMFVCGGLYGVGIIDRSLFEMLMGVLAGLGFVSTRLAIKKLE